MHRVIHDGDVVQQTQEDARGRRQTVLASRERRHEEAALGRGERSGHATAPHCQTQRNTPRLGRSVKKMISLRPSQPRLLIGRLSLFSLQLGRVTLPLSNEKPLKGRGSLSRQV